MKIRASSAGVMKQVKSFLDENKFVYKDISTTEAIVQNVEECKMRSMMQKHLDEIKIDFFEDFVLIDGNSVWSRKLITAEARKIKKSDSTAGISPYFYKFMHLNFTIAHHNISGWISKYPTSSDVLSVINAGKIPAWKCDVRVIVDDLKDILKKKRDTRQVNTKTKVKK